MEPRLPAKELSAVLRSSKEGFRTVHKKYSRRLEEIENELQTIRLADYGLFCQIGEKHRQKVFEKASKEATKRYEEIKAAEDACQIISSHPGDGLSASRITAGPRSEQYLGVSEAVLLARFQDSSQRLHSSMKDDEPDPKGQSAQKTKVRFGILRRLR